jgi:hypothetical protein
MKISSRLAVALVCLTAFTGAAFYEYSTTPELVRAANAFLASLNPQQLTIARLDFPSDERLKFKYTPGARTGLPLKAMEKHQRDLAYAMMAATLSQRGFIKATTIMSLEPILRQLEASRGNQIDRDAELYYFSIFGEYSNVLRFQSCRSQRGTETGIANSGPRRRSRSRTADGARCRPEEDRNH